MNNLWIYALGFLGQALFGARLIVQLFKSEKKGKVVSPTIFWQLSLIASFIFMVYGIIRADWVIIGGQFISYFIYVRNLQLKNAWKNIHLFYRIFLVTLPFGAIAYMVGFHSSDSPIDLNLSNIFHPIMILGTIGQLALNLRFVYQWYYSEKLNDSVLPLGFWQISTWASVLVIIYALFHPVHGYDPVLLVSQGLGIVVYIRNMILYKRSSIITTRS